MDLKHLKTFVELSKKKNFTRTAEALSYAQSNVTTQIRQLEEELQVKLFERMGKTVTLTAEGEELLPYAVKMLSMASEVEKLYEGEYSKKKLVIGASESLSIYVLPGILRRYREKYPDAEIHMKIVERENFITLLADNEIDIAAAIEVPLTDPTIIKIRDEKIKLGLFAEPAHPLVKKKKITVRDLENEPMVLTRAECTYRAFLEKEFEREGVTPKILLETSSVPALKEAAMIGLGICFLPEMTVEKELEEKKLVRLDYEADVPISMQFFYHKDKWKSPALTSFISEVEGVEA